MSALTDRLEAMLAAGEDSALLRFSLGNACIGSDPGRAAEHLQRAVEIDPTYSAAWKVLGKALDGAGKPDAAISVYEQGIDVAERKGDKQAAREMQVFLKRLLKNRDSA
jgi:Flp pilus assembly protein TadD